MKDKIFAELKSRYAGQLTIKFMEILAERMAGSITTEEEVKTTLDALDSGFIKVTDLQSEGDRRTTDSLTKQNALQAEIDRLKTAKKDEPKPGHDDKGKGEYDSNPVLAKLDAMEKELNALKNQKTSEKLSEQLQAKLSEKKIPSVFAETVTLTSVDDLDSAVAQAEAKYLAVQQQMKNEGILSDIPKQGFTGSDDDLVDSDIKGLANKF
jgi:hypothetical protein